MHKQVGGKNLEKYKYKKIEEAEKVEEPKVFEKEERMEIEKKGRSQVTLWEIIETIYENVREHDRKVPIEELYLITQQQDHKTAKGILHRDNMFVKHGCENAIICNISLLLKANYKPDEIIRGIINAIKQQKADVDMKEGAEKFK